MTKYDLEIWMHEKLTIRNLQKTEKRVIIGCRQLARNFKQSKVRIYKKWIIKTLMILENKNYELF